MRILNTAEIDDISPRASMWQKLGVAGFLFFVIKGLLWLAAPAVFYFLT